MSMFNQGFSRSRGLRAAAVALAGIGAGSAFGDAGGFRTAAPAQLSGSTSFTTAGWSVVPLLTVGEEGPNGEDANLVGLGFRPVGILDGIGVFPQENSVLRVLVNHELGGAQGYTYALQNGAQLRGGRVSYLDIDLCTRRVIAAGLAYHTVYDRAGAVVTNAVQINEGASSNPLAGFDRFCGSNGFLGRRYGLVADCYFMGEEVGEGGSTPSSGMGGQQVVIDVANSNAYVLPMLGRGAWEASTFIENFGSDKIVIMWGDDREGAPMWLYIGQKGGAAEGLVTPKFLRDNGLGLGELFVWVSDAGDASPQQFNGTGTVRAGRFVKVKNWDPALAATPNWDGLGFASQASLNAQAAGVGAFKFSRPEDVGTNPFDGTQVAHASTGRGSAFPADNWGTVYVFDFDDAALKAKLALPLGRIDDIPCEVRIAYDADDAGGGQFAHPDFGIRNADNLEWANDGFIYINEDRSTSPAALFGSVSGAEASVWRLDPVTGEATRILEIDRSAVPVGQNDPNPSDIGNWESSGVVDVSQFFASKAGETVLIMDVQAHNLSSPAGVGLARNGPQSGDLVEGGQLVLAFSGADPETACPADFDCDGDIGAADLAFLLGAWGPCYGCAGDLTGDNTVGPADLAILLGSWGTCR